MTFPHGPCFPFRYGPPYRTYSIYHYDGDPLLSPPVRYCIAVKDDGDDEERIVTTFPFDGPRGPAIIFAAKEALAKLAEVTDVMGEALEEYRADGYQ